jgi:hypothetical protein
VSRLAIVAALEALEVGDTDLAVAILLGALEDGPAQAPECFCPVCGASFDWPGLRDHHLQFAHGGLRERCAA